MPSHDLDLVSLMAGVAFVGLGVVGLLTQGDGLVGRWTLPVLLILVGVVGLVVSGRQSKPGGRR